MEIFNILTFPIEIILFLIWNKYFLFLFTIWVIFCYCAVNHVMKKTEKYIQIKKEDLDIHNKYNMFRRYDGKNWNKWKFLFGAIMFSWIKIPCGFFGMIFCYFGLKIVLKGKNIEDPNLIIETELRKKIVWVCQMSAKIILMSLGVFVEQKEINFDYSEYLGENYEKDKMASTYIVNHTSWLDIVLMGMKIGPAFVSSISVKSFPIVGYVTTAIGSIFVNRDDKMNRVNAINKLIEKQNKIHSGEDSAKLLIFPEGTTSNVTGIMPFKQGAFVSNLPIKPIIIKFDPINRISLAMDVIEIIFHIFIVLCVPFHHVELIELPTFSPNEYLCTKSKMAQKSEKGQKWTIYADSLREIMCKASGLDKIEGNWEMKSEYLNFLRKQKI